MSLGNCEQASGRAGLEKEPGRERAWGVQGLSAGVRKAGTGWLPISVPLEEVWVRSVLLSLEGDVCCGAWCTWIAWTGTCWAMAPPGERQEPVSLHGDAGTLTHLWEPRVPLWLHSGSRHRAERGRNQTPNLLFPGTRAKKGLTGLQSSKSEETQQQLLLNAQQWFRNIWDPPCYSWFHQETE